MSDFVGRREELGKLQGHLAAVRAGRSRLLVIRGRRQVGKSRLITEFVRQADVPQLFATGSLQSTVRADLGLLAAEVARSSTLPGRDLLSSNLLTTWDGALRLIAAALPIDGPAIVVLDEFPWFVRRDPGLEGALQVIWDQVLENKQVLLILVGSDLAMMEALSTYGRPLYGRTKELTVRPFNAGDTATMLSHVSDAGDALDFQLITGGFPRLVGDAATYETARQFVHAELRDDNSSLCVNAMRMLEAELPSGSQADPVLRAIGSGERTFRNVAHSSGLADQPVQRALATLIEKDLVRRDLPTSVPPAEHPRYRIADSYLRLWLALIDPGLSDTQRGRPDLAIDRFERSWPAWRGRAVEPLVREALARMAVDDARLGNAAHVSGWWPRNNNPEVDLVGVDRAADPTSIRFVGSIKWRENAPFGREDLRKLQVDANAVPGADAATPLVAVARQQVDVDGVIAYTARDLVGAWGPHCSG